MGNIKTVVTKKDINQYIKELENPLMKEDTLIILDLFMRATGEEPQHYVGGMIGFGVYHYKSERSKQEGDWPLAAFATRKTNITIYGMKFLSEDKNTLKKLGKAKLSGGCLHIHRLSDVDLKLLEKLVKQSYKEMKKITKAKK